MENFFGDARCTNIITCALNNFFNSLNALGVFFLLKLVVVLFFLLRLHSFFFFLLSTSVVGSYWFFIVERVVAWVKVKVLRIGGDCCGGCFIPVRHFVAFLECFVSPVGFLCRRLGA